VIMKMATCRSSGEFLPYLLQKKYKEYRASKITASDSNNEQSKMRQTSDGGEPKVVLHKENALYQSSSDEFGQDIFLLSSSMIDIQRQLHRGEELYFEDTQAHGNIYRGWDAFVDLKDVGTNAGSMNQPGSYRRMPSDHRWFSGSCKSVARSSRPVSRNRILASPSPSFPSRSNAATPVSVAPAPAATAAVKVSNDTKVTASPSNSLAQIQQQAVGEHDQPLKTNNATEDTKSNATSQNMATTTTKEVSKQPVAEYKIPRVSNQTDQQRKDVKTIVEPKQDFDSGSHTVVADEKASIKRHARKRKMGEN